MTGMNHEIITSDDAVEPRSPTRKGKTSMTTDHEFETPRAELAHLLDTWGNDRTRWPIRVRARIAVLSATVPEAGVLFAEARALDRLLDEVRDAPAGVTPARASRLSDRIMAAALASTPPAAASSSQRPPGATVVAIRPKAPPRPVFARGWQAASLIAASLMTGIYLGGSLNLTPVLQELAEAAGMSAVIDPTIASIGDDLYDEETL